MKPSITSLLFCCTLFFAGNSYAQNTRVENIDKAVMEHTGMDIAACPGIDRSDTNITVKTSHPNRRTLKKGNYTYVNKKANFTYIKKGNYTYAYNQAHKIWNFSMNATAKKETDKSEYKKIADVCTQLQASLGKPDKSIRRRRFTFETWKGDHGMIIHANNERTGSIGVMYFNKDLAAK